MSTSEIWDAIRSQAVQRPDLPANVMDLLRQPFTEVTLLGEIKCEEQHIKQSYLDFLQEQIILNARGDEWSSLLKQRHHALEPYLGRKVGFLSFTSSDWSLWIRFEPGTLQTVWFEYFDKQ